MAKIDAFEHHINEYEHWFIENRYAFESEVIAIKILLPQDGNGIEIGVGSGLFARELGLNIGLDPSPRMRLRAKERDILVTGGVAEFLPFKNAVFDYALMVTTICFVDDVYKTICEAHRVIKINGMLIVAMVDKLSPLGKLYRQHQGKSVFYRDAKFYSTKEIVQIMQQVGFHKFRFTQTIFRSLDQINKLDEVKDGYGQGSFVVISARKGKKNAQDSNLI